MALCTTLCRATCSLPAKSLRSWPALCDSTDWTVDHQAPLSMGFSRQEHWSGLPCPPPRDLPDPEIEPVSLTSPTLAGGFLTPAPLGSPSLGSQAVKNLPAMRETWVPSLGQEDALEKGMATHSSILAWRIPWTEEPGGLQSMGSQKWDTT